MMIHDLAPPIGGRDLPIALIEDVVAVGGGAWIVTLVA
ncbi:MAG: hypothetical protein JWP92_1751 [Caulobacter sp.]|nr:hypothetical protein [Caulobacter sp.]